MVFRHSMLVVLAVVSATGCRAVGTGGGLTPPEPIAARPPLEAEEIIARINRNARQVQSLKADPSITVIVANKERHPLNARMAMQRPRNFKLELFAPTITQAEEADIGSNEQGFWFWVKRSKEKEVYVCNYDDSGSSPLAVAFQPDWIVEALGLREIPPDEAAGYKVSRGSGTYAGSLILTQRRESRDGDGYTKMIIVDASTGLIHEHRLYERDQKTLLARAVIPQGRYQRVRVSSGTGGESESTVVLPSKIQLSWIREQLELVVDLGRPKINPEFSRELFEEPPFKGYSRVNIAELAGSAHGTTTIRETWPPPPSGVRLNDPEPLGRDDTSRAPTPSTTLASDEPRLRERVVGARIPTAPVPDALKPDGAAWARVQPRDYEP